MRASGGLLLAALLVVGCSRRERGEAPRAASTSKPQPAATGEPERRGPTTLHLRGNGKHPSVDRAMPASKYIERDVVSVQPGEVFTVAGTLQGDRLVHLHRVEFAPKAKDTLTFSFKQEDDRMMLLVENGFSRPVKYAAEMLVPDRASSLKTSVCPVRGGLETIESWPHPILKMSFKEFVFSAPGSTAPCK